MKKEIHFAGINVVPTDHDAQDGMLEAAYNLLPERSGPLPYPASPDGAGESAA